MTAKDMQVIQEHYTDASRELIPARYGKWVLGKDIPEWIRREHPAYMFLPDVKYCSACYNEAYWDTDYGQQLFVYCPYCGADMKRGIYDD